MNTSTKQTRNSTTNSNGTHRHSAKKSLAICLVVFTASILNAEAFAARPSGASSAASKATSTKATSGSTKNTPKTVNGDPHSTTSSSSSSSTAAFLPRIKSLTPEAMSAIPMSSLESTSGLISSAGATTKPTRDPSSSSRVFVDEEDAKIISGLFSKSKTPSLSKPATKPLARSSSATASKKAPVRKAPRKRATVEQQIKSEDEWHKLIAEGKDSDSQITAVKFHASWCKSCQRLNHMWEGKVLRKYGKASANDENVDPTEPANTFKFASVEFTKNKALCEKLGITKLPTVQYYYKGQLLTTLTGGAKKMAQYTSAFENYQTSSKSELQFEIDLQSHKASFVEAMKTSDVSGSEQKPQKEQKQKMSLKDRLTITGTTNGSSVTGASSNPTLRA